MQYVQVEADSSICQKPQFNTDNNAAVLHQRCRPKLSHPEGGSVRPSDTLTSTLTIISYDNRSWHEAITSVQLNLHPCHPATGAQRTFMYVIEAWMHVWLCDNTGPVWQAPRIIALGRELHNNVGLGNACGLGPSAVRGPIKVSSEFTHTWAMGTRLHTFFKYEGFHFSFKW